MGYRPLAKIRRPPDRGPHVIVTASSRVRDGDNAILHSGGLDDPGIGTQCLGIEQILWFSVTSQPLRQNRCAGFVFRLAAIAGVAAPEKAYSVRHLFTPGLNRRITDRSGLSESGYPYRRPNLGVGRGGEMIETKTKKDYERPAVTHTEKLQGRCVTCAQSDDTCAAGGAIQS